MAAAIPTMPPAGVNALAHPATERRAPAAVPAGDTPTRRASRRRFLAEAGATIAAGLGVTAVVLAPDPDWSAPSHAAAGVGDAPTLLPSPDAALFAAIARGTAIYAKAKAAEAKGWGSYRAWILEHCHDAVEVDDFIFATRPATHEGVMAKAGYALKNYREPAPGEGKGLWHHPYSALLDLYRLAGGVA